MPETWHRAEQYFNGVERPAPRRATASRFLIPVSLLAFGTPSIAPHNAVAAPSVVTIDIAHSQIPLDPSIIRTPNPSLDPEDFKCSFGFRATPDAVLDPTRYKWTATGAGSLRVQRGLTNDFSPFDFLDHTVTVAVLDSASQPTSLSRNLGPVNLQPYIGNTCLIDTIIDDADGVASARSFGVIAEAGASVFLSAAKECPIEGQYTWTENGSTFSIDQRPISPITSPTGQKKTISLAYAAASKTCSQEILVYFISLSPLTFISENGTGSPPILLSNESYADVKVSFSPTLNTTAESSVLGEVGLSSVITDSSGQSGMSVNIDSPTQTSTSRTFRVRVNRAGAGLPWKFRISATLAGESTLTSLEFQVSPIL